jgi:hypothetical protein
LVAAERSEAALGVYTELEFPEDWAKTTAYLGAVAWTIAWEWKPEWAARDWERAQMWTSAEEHLERAITTFRSIAHEHQVQEHEALLAKVVAERNAAADQDGDA